MRAAALCAGFYAHAGVEATAQQDTLLAIDREAQQNAMGYRWLRWSTDHIGHRLTGSSNGRRAEQAADSLFRVAGLDQVHRFAFDASAWSRASVNVEVLQVGTWQALPSVALANTPVSCNVELDLVDAGNGLRADFDQAGDALRGKAVLMNLGLVGAPTGTPNLHRSEKTALAIEHGAGAVLFVNNVEGHVLLTGTASIDGKLITIPAACITAEEGAGLRTTMLHDVHPRIRISMRNSVATVTAHNVIAEIRGTRWPEEVVLVGGHLDSWDLATGATDNGLGSFSIIDLARCLRALDLRPLRTIRFVLFMGEEQGLLGSRALVGHYARTGELDHIRCMINLDMSGHPKGFGVGGPAGWADLVRTINTRIHAHDTTFEAKEDEHPGLHSDHQPFLLNGVPVLWPICDLGGHVYGCYHSSCDDIHLVDPQAMVDNVRFVGMLVHQLAMAPALPPRFAPTELRERLVREGLEEPLRLGGDWPWEGGTESGR